MSRPRRQQLPPVPKRWRLPAGLRETVVLLLLASAAFLLLALLSFDAQDANWASTGGHAGVHNAGGRIGANWAGLLYYFFGYPALLIPALLLWFGWRVYRSGDQGVPVRARGVAVRLLGLLLAMTCGAALAQLYLAKGALPNGPGGGLGMELGRMAAGSLNTAGATLFLVAAGLSGITWVTGFSWLKLTELLGIAVVQGRDGARPRPARVRGWRGRQTGARRPTRIGGPPQGQGRQPQATAHRAGAAAGRDRRPGGGRAPGGAVRTGAQYRAHAAAARVCSTTPRPRSSACRPRRCRRSRGGWN